MNRGGRALGHGITGGSNSIEILKESFNASMNSALAKETSGSGFDIAGLKIDEDPDVKEFIKQLDISRVEERQRIRKTISNNDSIDISNPLHMGSDVFGVANMYRSCFKNDLQTPMGGVDTDPALKPVAEGVQIGHKIGSPSLFNPFYAVDALGITDGIPLLDTTTSATTYRAGSFSMKQSETTNFGIDINDCSIKNLVNLSKLEKSPLGQARYKYTDFMYCADVGKVSNNHMITLRKFAAPVGDNIFSGVVDLNDLHQQNGDIGRMITWFDTEDNRLEDIIQYNYSVGWKEYNSEIETKESQEGTDQTGILGKAVMFTGNSWYKYFKEGTASAPWTPGKLQGIHKMWVGQHAGDTNYPGMFGSMYDQHKIYEPKDTIRSTHIYDGELKFNQEFTLTFKYKLRAYDGINPKSAALDLLGNVLSVTYRKGTFWGGEQRIIGPQPNAKGWNFANKLLSSTGNFGGTMLQSIMSGTATSNTITSAFSNFLSKSGLSNIVENIKSKSAEVVDKIKSDGWKGAAEEITKVAKSPGVSSVLTGAVKNLVGRPYLYAFNSLLTGDPVGLWHVTIGNPLNPIMCMGNMIITDTKIQQSGPLGFDDFPTEMKVSVTLKHATPRDMVDISKMYTKGINAIYMPMVDERNYTNYSSAASSYSEKDMMSYDSDNRGKTIFDAQGNPILATDADGKNIPLMDKATGKPRMNADGTPVYAYLIQHDTVEADRTHSAEFAAWMGDFNKQRLKCNRDAVR